MVSLCRGLDAVDYTKSLFRNASDNPIRIDIPTQHINALTKPARLQPSRYEHFYVVDIYELNSHQKPAIRAPTKFTCFRRFLDMLSPYRISSVLVDPQTQKRKLRFIFDTRVQTVEFLRSAYDNYPVLQVKAIRKQRYY